MKIKITKKLLGIKKKHFRAMVFMSFSFLYIIKLQICLSIKKFKLLELGVLRSFSLNYFVNYWFDRG